MLEIIFIEVVALALVARLYVDTVKRKKGTTWN